MTNEQLGVLLFSLARDMNSQLLQVEDKLRVKGLSFDEIQETLRGLNGFSSVLSKQAGNLGAFSVVLPTK